MANVTLYTPEELTAMGWVFNNRSYDKWVPFEDEFVEGLNQNVPEGLPDEITFQNFKPYFNGPYQVPAISYNNFISHPLLFGVARFPTIFGEFAFYIKLGAFIISGLKVGDAKMATFGIVCYASGDQDINYEVELSTNGTADYKTIINGWAKKLDPDDVPTVTTTVSFSNAPKGSDILIRISKLTNGAGTLYISPIGMSGVDLGISETISKKTFTDPKTGEVRTYNNTSPACYRESDSELAAATYASAIEYGEQVLVASEPDKIYFEKEELYQWISPQQLEQFEKMYPACFEVSYNSALGYLYSQIGELYDIPAILAGDTNDGTAKIMRWILTVLTAYNITSPSARHSETLRDNFDMVVKKITEMKNGATTLNNAPIKEEPSAWGKVVNSGKHKMLG